MPPFAIKNGDTIFIVDPSQIRWFEHNDRFNDLTLFYHNGAMEVIRSRHAKQIFNDLQLQFNVLNVKDYDIGPN
jgi:hypothetical protein